MLDDSAIVFFSNRNSQLMLAFCTRVSQDPRSIRFLFDGSVLDPEGTAESLNMEDGDEIDAMLSQIGKDKHRHYNKLLYTPVPSPALPPALTPTLDRWIQTYGHGICFA